MAPPHNVKGTSNVQGIPGVYGENTANGDGVVGAGWRGVVGTSTKFQGVYGHSTENAGVVGESDHLHGVFAICHNPYGAGVFATNDAGGIGVTGESKHGNGTGVYGESQNWEGVHGVGHGRGAGVAGINNGPSDAAAPGVWGESQTWEGVHGVGHAHGAGVTGFNDGPPENAGPGVWGESTYSEGVHGVSHGRAVGVFGESHDFDGVFGVSRNPNAAGVSGHNVNADGTPNPNGLAGWFDGNVTITGNHQCNGNSQVNGNHTVLGDIFVPGADCAEHFEIAGLEEFEPGTVMVIDGHGPLTQSSQAYDKKVAGVISGAGKFRPGIILDKQQDCGNRLPIALVGKVYCKVDADLSPVEVGDMLTTSPTPGHAMKAQDPLQSFGAVIGKALESLPDGKGLLPILVCLQ